MASYQFSTRVEEYDWPYGRAAQRATLEIVLDGQRVTIDGKDIRLTAGEWRALVRQALIGLGYTTIARVSGSRQSTWDHNVEKVVTPAMKMIGALLPKPPREQPREEVA